MIRLPASIFLLGIVLTASSTQPVPQEQKVSVVEQKLPASLLKEGVEYTPIQPARPTTIRHGRVEVLEAFSYGCGHCYSLEPHLAAWLKSKPAHVDFVRVHAGWQGAGRSYSRLYYTLQALGRMDLHDTVFKTVFEDAQQLGASDEDQAFGLQLAFATAHGIDADEFSRTYRSSAITQEMQRSRDRLRECQIASTPTFVINGKYQIHMIQRDHEANLMAVINDVVEYERQPR